MEPPYFPVDMSALKAKFSDGCRCDRTKCNHCPGGDIKSIQCHSIPLSHPNGGYGFKFISDGRSFIFLSDNELRYKHEGGLTVDEYAEFCRGADLLIHDAQYTEDEYKKTVTWGHSTFRDAVDLALQAGVKRLGLFHHDPDRTDEEINKQVALCRSYISGKKSSLECFACAESMVIKV